MAKRRVVVTGAAGYVAQRMWGELSERWDLVPIDVRATTRDGRAVPGMVVADLTRPERDQYRRHFEGADAVIHCGFVRPAADPPVIDARSWSRHAGQKRCSPTA